VHEQVLAGVREIDVIGLILVYLHLQVGDIKPLHTDVSVA
jgi:hypothetical protein